MSRDTLIRHLSPSSLLRTLLDVPDLPARLHTLPPSRFSTLVREVGVEDAGELLALATDEQLRETFDEHLFTQAAAGDREAFDVERFGTFLAVLREGGDARAAARIAALSVDFVVLAWSRLMMVLDIDALRDTLEDGEDDDARAADKALESALTEEIDGYLLVARHPEWFDDAVAIVLALDQDHREFLQLILDRVASLTAQAASDPAELVEALSTIDALAEEVESEREDRRARDGHVAPRDAKAFLSLARGGGEVRGRDAITSAYFRALDRSRRAGPGRLPTRAPTSAAPAPRLPASVERALDGAIPARMPAEGDDLVRAALRALAERDPAAFEERLEELAFLVNVLTAANTRPGERPDVVAAAQEALTTIRRGLTVEFRDHPDAVPVEQLRRTPLDRLFRRGAASEPTETERRGSRQGIRARHGA